jgi:hypothetical protein
MQVPEIIVCAILAIFIVADTPLPAQAQAVVSSTIGCLVLVGVVVYLFSKSPILGLLGAVAGFMMTRRSAVTNPSRLFEPTLDDQERHSGYIPNVGDTLEEQIIQKMVPMVR